MRSKGIEPPFRPIKSRVQDQCLLQARIVHMVALVELVETRVCRNQSRQAVDKLRPRLMPKEGVEPSCPKAQHFKCCVYAIPPLRRSTEHTGFEPVSSRLTTARPCPN